MRRLLAGLTAFVLVSMAAPPVVAQEPSPEPPPWLGGRVEMPEHGFALTLPDDWVAFDTAADAASQLGAASDFLDPVLWSADDGRPQAMLANAASQGAQLFLGHATSTDLCFVGAFPVSAMPAHDFADQVYEQWVDNPAALDVEPPQRIYLRTGLAYRIRVVDSTSTRTQSTYVLAVGDVVLSVLCSTDDRPEADSLSIAESFEFLPEEE